MGQEPETMRLIPPDAARKRRWFATAALGATLLGFAAAARAETLADAVALAYQSNPAILAQRAQVRALNETYVQARSNWGPRVSVDVNAEGEDLRMQAQTYKGRGTGANLTVTQPLFTGGRVSAAVEAAEGDVRSARERLRQAEADLLQRVVTAYVSVRRDQGISTVAHQTVTVLQQQLEETRAKVDVRENTRTDLAQAEARLAAAQAQAFNADAQLASSRALYLNAVGQNPGALAPEPDLGGLPASVDQAFDAAEAENPTLLAAKYTELASRARVQQARAQNAPSVDLRVQAGSNPYAPYLAQIRQESVLAQATVSQPLFTAGLNGSQIRRALETNNSDRLTIDATRRNVIQTVSQQWSQLAAARSSLAADQANVTAAETAFFGMRQEERFGLRSTIELLNTQQELTSAQIGLLRDRYAEYVSRAAVLNVMGRLTVELLAPGVKSYDPAPDFDRVKNKGALPTEQVVRALDAIAKPPLGPPVAARETAVPDAQLPLPAAPPSAASPPPMESMSKIMDDTRNLGR